MKLASIVLFEILRKDRVSITRVTIASSLPSIHSPGMGDLAGLLLQPANRHPSINRNIVSFRRTNIDLPTSLSTLNHTQWSLSTYLSRSPNLHTSLLEHHLMKG